MRAAATTSRRLIPLTKAAEILAESIDRLIGAHPVNNWRGRSA